ncbi:MAG: stage IV sporulation protein A [bacterium]
MEEKSLEAVIKRCQGEFYLGVVGAVRSGKSTFINKFIENKVMPYVSDDFLKNKIVDELPQTAQGKKITTVEPKFIPNNAITVNVNNVSMNVRLVDSVGYVIPNALGHFDDEGPRMVKTPWFEDSISFKEAAEIGTKKVIENHSTIGIVLTSDGTISDFSREDYKYAEETVINQLQELNKPFVVVINTSNPNSKEAISCKNEIEEKYNVSACLVNVLYMDSSDIDYILDTALQEFNIENIDLELPKYLTVLNEDNDIKKRVMQTIEEQTCDYKKFKDIKKIKEALQATLLFKTVDVTLEDASTSSASIELTLDDQYYEDIIESLIGKSLDTKGDLIAILSEYSTLKQDFSQIGDALKSVNETGYGISLPSVKQMKLLKPEVIKQSGRFGVKLKAVAPSIHLIKVDVESTFEPIIGSEEQSKLLIDNLLEGNDEITEVWDKEIFGRKLSEVVNDGIKTKIHMIPENAKVKLQDTLTRIVNTKTSGLIAIIL